MGVTDGGESPLSDAATPGADREAAVATVTPPDRDTPEDTPSEATTPVDRSSRGASSSTESARPERAPAPGDAKPPAAEQPGDGTTDRPRELAQVRRPARPLWYRATDETSAEADPEPEEAPASEPDPVDKPPVAAVAPRPASPSVAQRPAPAGARPAPVSARAPASPRPGQSPPGEKPREAPPRPAPASRGETPQPRPVAARPPVAPPTERPAGTPGPQRAAHPDQARGPVTPAEQSRPAHQHRRPPEQPAQQSPPRRPAPAGQPAADQPRAPRSDRSFGLRTLALTALVTAVVGGLIGLAGGRWLGLGAAKANVAVSATVPVDGAGSVADAAEKALPSVVTILVQGRDGATGSGVIIDPSGYVLTNSHVITPALSGGGTIVVTRNQDLTQIPADLVAEDAKSDLAVLKIKADGPFPAATLGHSSALRVGSPVIAIGASLGLPGTVTTGIVSALDRAPTEPVNGASVTLSGAIQTDAAINPGSSGGPLLDALGQVVGINTAIASVPGAPGGTDGQTGSVGVGFAIPIDYARSIAEEIIKSGHATHPVLGFSSATITAAEAQAIGREPGAMIRQVDPAAAAAGLRVGDIVTKVDDVVITNGDQVIDAARSHRVGDRVTVTYERSGATRTAQVTLKEQRA